MSSMRVNRSFSVEFREMAVRRLRETDNMAALCRELGISRQLLYHWRDRLEEQTKPDSAAATERQLRQEIQKLKQALGEKSLEVDFLRGASAKIEALRRSSTVSGAMASTSRSGK